MKARSLLIGAVLSVSALTGQTRIDLSSQTRGLLPDLDVKRTSNAVLTIGGSCSLTKPCSSRIGGTSYSYTTSATVTISTGTPTVRIYVSDGADGAPAGTLKVRNSVASGVTCSSGCTVENSQSAFPGVSIPLAVWTASTNGQWDIGGMDHRAFLSSQPALVAGVGIVMTPDTVAVDTSLIPKKFSGSGPPSSLSGSGRGDFYTDTLNGDAYQCFAPAPCSAVAEGNWVKLSTGPQAFLTGPWFFYGRGSAVTGLNPSLGEGATNGVVLMGKTDTAARQIRRIAFSVTTPATNNCGVGSSPCGLTIALLDATRSTVVCQAEVATGGNESASKDINAVGSKNLVFSSGSRVSGGACTLPFGNYWWAIGTDSANLQIAADSSATAGTLLGNAVPTDVMLGTIMEALTGTGGTLAFANLGEPLTPANIGLPILAGLY